MKPTRREALAAAALVPAATEGNELVRRHERAVERLLELQITDPGSRWCGGYADDTGLCNPHSAAAILHEFTAALLNPESKFRGSALLAERMQLAARHLDRRQTPDGNFDLVITNFNSPPDTGFLVHSLGSAACLASRAKQRDLLKLMEPVLKRAGAGMAKGGVHTPNHRWVTCAALAQINEVFPDPAYVRRIGQWLAEGIDIDADGQYTERSTTVYNPACDRAFVVMAAKLNRPELLDPVRRNLDSMLYLLHPGYEVVTEISRRQDLNQRGTMAPYWFPLAYLAARDRNGVYATLARQFAPTAANLAAVMEYPEIAGAGPDPVPVPEEYEKQFPLLEMARIRRGLISASVLLAGRDRFLTLRRGDAVVNAIRFASAFFGKGQFVPSAFERRGREYVMRQSLEAGYVQPLDPPRNVPAGAWGSTRAARRETEVCRLEQSASVAETSGGFRVFVSSKGTPEVPLAIEINFREGGRIEGCRAVPKVQDAWILESGRATYRAGAYGVRFGPGSAPHRYTQVRGAQPKLPGPSVYITGYTPFEHVIDFEWV